MLIVLDTNVLISALLKQLGLPAMILQMILADKLPLAASSELFAEYEKVLEYPRISRRLPVVLRRRILRDIAAISKIVEPLFLLDVCSDPDDNRILECADAANADFLITGNTKDFPAQWKQTRIVTPYDFLQLL